MSTTPSQFFFHAMTPQGRKMLGLRPALDETHLGEDLRRDQLLLLQAWRLPIGGGASSRTIPISDDAALNEQLNTLLTRGVPLVEALEVAATVVSPSTSARILKLREMVAAGASFSSACEQAGGFDEVNISVYRASERTGDVAGAAKRLADSARRRLSIRGKALTVMVYPAIVFSISVIISLGLLMFLVPMIADQLRQMKVKPNAYSQVVFGTGEWMRANLGLTFGIIIGLIVLAAALRHIVAAAFFRLMSRIPAVARLLLVVELTRFFAVMAAMTKSGVPLADALATASNVITAPRLRDQLRTLQKNLVEGGVWRLLVEKVDAMPLATRRLLIAAEKSGDLDTAFDGLSADMAQEVDTRSSRLLAFLEPGAIVLMFMLIGPLILAIAIPLLTFRTQVK